MPLGERVTNYTIAEFKNDIVDYQQVAKFTTESGHQVFIGFPDQPPAEWLTVTGTNTTAFLERGEFDRIHHLLQSETPLFFSSLIFEGLRAFNLSTGPELPGEGPADDDALVQLMARIRQRQVPTISGARADPSARGVLMPLSERVTDYTIAEFKNDIVDYQQVVKFTTESGHQVFIGFPDQPPAQWLTVTETNTTAFLERGEFDRIYNLLQSETPLFFTSGFLFGSRVFNLSTGPELPGEGPADDDALVQLMATIRQHLADSGEPSSG